MTLPRTASQTGGGATATTGLLTLNNIEVIYDEVILVLRGLSLEVPQGKIIALLGSNGAGKSTTLKAVSGLLPTEHGDVTDGKIIFDGQDITHLDAAARVRRGMSLCMEGRHVFEHLTVQENLVAGAYFRGRSDIGTELDLVYGLLPKLADLRAQIAGYLSGGEQQMLAIGRALMASPKLLVLDEPSLGLAPMIVEQIADILTTINRAGTSVLLVEQNAMMALSISHYGYVMETGRVVRSAPAPDLLADKDIREFYLGVGEAGRHSFRSLKTRRAVVSW